MTDTGPVRQSEAIEREVKFDVDPDFELPDLGRVAGGLTVTVLPELVLDAQYWDTADGVLLTHGITVRRRTGEGTRWTVKLPSPVVVEPGSVARREVDVFSESAEPPVEVLRLLDDAWAEMAAEAEAETGAGTGAEGVVGVGAAAVAVIEGGAGMGSRPPLVPSARLVSRRRRCELHDQAGGSAGEIDDDLVSVHDGPVLAGSFREVELEFAGDVDPAVVAATVAALGRAGARPAPAASKLARALALVNQA